MIASRGFCTIAESGFSGTLCSCGTTTSSSRSTMATTMKTAGISRMPVSASRTIGAVTGQHLRSRARPRAAMKKQTSETTRTASTSDRMKMNEGVRPPVDVWMLIPMPVMSSTSDSCVG